MRVSFILTIICLVLLSNTAQSQTKLSGLIYNEKRDPLPFVNVLLINSNDDVVSFTCSDKDGFYELNNIGQGVLS